MDCNRYWAQVRRLEESWPDETVIVTDLETGEPIRAARRQAAEGIVSGRLRMATRDEANTLRHRDSLHLQQSDAQQIARRASYQVRIGRQEQQELMDASPAAAAYREKQEQKS